MLFQNDRPLHFLGILSKIRDFIWLYKTDSLNQLDNTTISWRPNNMMSESVYSFQMQIILLSTHVNHIPIVFLFGLIVVTSYSVRYKKNVTYVPS